MATLIADLEPSARDDSTLITISTLIPQLPSTPLHSSSEPWSVDSSTSSKKGSTHFSETIFSSIPTQLGTPNTSSGRHPHMSHLTSQRKASLHQRDSSRGPPVPDQLALLRIRIVWLCHGFHDTVVRIFMTTELSVWGCVRIGGYFTEVGQERWAVGCDLSGSQHFLEHFVDGLTTNVNLSTHLMLSTQQGDSDRMTSSGWW